MPRGNPFFSNPKIVLSSLNRPYYIDIKERKRLELPIYNIYNIAERRPLDVYYDPVHKMEVLILNEPKLLVAFQGEVIF